MNCLGLDATDRSGPSPPHIQDFRSELYIPPRSHRSEEHTSELQSPCNLVCRLLLEKKNNTTPATSRTHGAPCPQAFSSTRHASAWQHAVYARSSIAHLCLRTQRLAEITDASTCRSP